MCSLQVSRFLRMLRTKTINIGRFFSELFKNKLTDFAVELQCQP